MSILYRSSDGLADYEFLIVRIPDGRYRAYVAHQPPYRSRDASLAVTHRERDCRGNYVVGPPVWAPEPARELAACWAEANQGYLTTGSWDWDVRISPRYLGVVSKILDTYAFARDAALHRDVLLLAKFAPLGFEFRHGRRISYALVVDDRGRGLQARDIRGE